MGGQRLCRNVFGKGCNGQNKDLKCNRIQNFYPGHRDYSLEKHVFTQHEI